MTRVAITGTGLFVPPHKVTNEQLVDAFNKHVDIYNHTHKAEIDAGVLTAKLYSNAEFIEKASGIKSRYFIEREGVLDPKRLMAHLPEDAYGDTDTPSIQANMAIKAGEQAIEQAGLRPEDIDFVICSAATMQRAFPAISIEVQKFLGTEGAAMDMVMGCSSATFAIIQGVAAVKSGLAKRVLMVNPEIFSTMVNFADRDSHFIFGDIATACIIESVEDTKSKDVWAVENIKQETNLSENIHSNYGPMTRLDNGSTMREDMFFVQQGRKVFKELLPMVTKFIESQLTEVGLKADDLARMWLHQANINMNMYAAKKLLNREPSNLDAPVVLEEYGNTAGAGSLVAFHKYRSDLTSGDRGLICSFGAGYSIGGLIVEKVT